MTVPSVCLVVLDGWGLAPEGPGNAVALADTPVLDRIWAEHPHTTLIACGESVGLPAGQMGNSEVGHLNLGAGAIVPQDLARIDKAVEDGTLGDSEVLRELMEGAERVHLIGLVSDGGVHSSDRHLKALVELAAAKGVPDVSCTRSRTGATPRPRAARSSSPRSRRCDGARVGSRHRALLRDGPRRALGPDPEGLRPARPRARASTTPTAPSRPRRTPTSATRPTSSSPRRRSATTREIRPGDAVLGFNFRPDRMREITRALAEDGFDEIDRGGGEVVERYATLAEYDEDWDYPVVFPPERPAITLAQVIADRGLKQLHVAETEKYPHVTYFFNGGEEDEHEGETFKLVPSPRDVPTYDHKPEMSAYEATDAFVERFEADEPAFAIINFANADMVGHTGVIEAAVKAVEAVDECLGRVLETVHAAGGACIVTADHGNADEMLEEDGSPDTAHSLNPVPFVDHGGRRRARRGGDPRRRRPDRARAAGDRAATRDDRPLAARLSRALRRAPT